MRKLTLNPIRQTLELVLSERVKKHSEIFAIWIDFIDCQILIAIVPLASGSRRTDVKKIRHGSVNAAASIHLRAWRTLELSRAPVTY